MRGLRKSERCPIHKSLFCCGRESKNQMPRRTPIKGPVTRVPDATVPRGYIEVCSPSELRRRKMILIERQKGQCALCPWLINDVRDAEVDHKVPRPAGCLKDSHWDNIQAAHRSCNLAKGSRRDV